MSLVIAQIIRRRAKKFQAFKDDYYNLHINRMRKNFTFLANTFMPILEERTWPILVAFLNDNSYNHQLKVQARNIWNRIVGMQKKIRAQQKKQVAKVDVLMNYWDKMYGTIMSRAVELKDANCKKLCKELILVPPHIQRVVLREYVDRCQELHAIAFFQWRYLYPNKVRYRKKQIEELIKSMMDRINMFLKYMKHTEMTSISEETKEASVIAKNFLTEKRYDIIDKRKANFLINRFWTVGFADPYPDDDKFIIGSVDDVPDDMQPPSKPEDHVYPDSRYV